MPIRTVFIDTELPNYQSLAAQYDAGAFNIVLLNHASSHAEQIQSWMTSNGASAADINIVSASTSVNGSFTTRVVFVDASIADLATVIAGVPANATVVVLDPTHDGVQQIRDYLAANGGKVGAVDIVTDLASVDVVSHGAPGEVMLGSTVLNAANLAAYQSQLAEIGSHLTAGGDILLYGCDVASGTSGQQFISALAAATGADVAASTDLTGGAAAGGDWVLEASTGTIEAAALNIAGYGGTLGQTITNIKISPDTGSNPNDFITKDNVQSVTFSVTGDNNPIYVSIDGGNKVLATFVDKINGKDNYSAQVGTVSTEGGHLIHFWDQTGTTELIPSGGVVQGFTLDKTPPTAGTLSFSGLSDSGTPGDSITTDKTFSLALGGNDSNTTVTYQMSFNGGLFGSTTTAQNNLADGIYVFRAIVTDVAGNTATTNTASVTIDNKAPDAPAITGFSDNSGSTSDTVTNDKSPTLTITAEANATVEVFRGTTSVGYATQTAPGSGVYNFTSLDLVNGSYSFTAKATDGAGNTSAASAPQAITVDAIVPVAPAITGFSDNSGSTSDTVTNDKSPTLTITAEANATVEVFRGPVSVGYATQTAAGSGVYTFTSPDLDNGSYSFTATATDAAGNTSAASVPQAITVDAIVPAAPAITGFSDNSGSTSDTVTNDTTPTLTITAEADTTVEVFKGTASVGYASQTAAGSGIYTFTSAALGDGSYSFTAKATDAAGNTSAASAPQAITVDAIVPAAPAITGFSDNSGSTSDTVTNDTTPTFTITAEANTTVEVFRGGASVGNATQTAAGSGIYTFTSAVLGDGSYSFTAKATDAAGNTSAASAPQAVTVDAIVPAAPAITGFSDNSGSTSDSVTNDTTPTLTITAEANTTVEVFKGGVSVGNATQTAAGSGNYTFTSAVLGEGSYNFTAKATDVAGNTSAASAVQNVTVDGTAPVAPAITGFSDNSGSTSDNLTNDTTPTLTITAEADTTVEVFKGTASVGNATQTAAGSGIYTFTSAVLGDGSYNFTAKATDAAGNTSPASAAQAITVDASAPVAPVITGFSDNSGSTSDTITNDTTPTLTITAEADTTVEVFKGGVSVGTATQTAAGSGIYSFTSATLADGSYNFTAKATDAAGNTSAASAVQNVTVDGTAPVAPTITGFSDNSGSTSDTVTNDTTPTLTITAEADTTVEVFKGGVSIGNATQTAAGSGIYTFTSATLADGSYSFTAKATDAAGNTSAASAVQNVTVDATAPVAPAITGFSDNSGSADDTVTNDTTPTLTITAEADTTVEVFKGGVSVGTAVQTAAGSGIYTFTSAVLGDGSYSFTAKATDAAGNTSPASAVQNVTVDGTAPVAPAITGFSDNSGSTSDNLTNDTTPTLTITAEADTTVEVFKGGVSVGTAVQTAAGSGIYTFTSATLGDGSYNFTAKATDVAGNTSAASAVQNVTVDGTAPVAPAITGFSDNSGSTSDTVTNDTTPTLTITAEADTTIEVFKGGVSVGTAVQTAAGSGIYTFTSAVLGDGSYSFTAKATDAAGNTSAASAVQNVTVDATAPVAPAITGFSDNSGSTSDTVTNDTTPTLTITAEADTTVEVFKGGVSVGTATQTAAGSGIYTFTSATLADGSYNFTAKATDTAGNTSHASAPQAITVDAIAPVAPAITGFSDNSGSADDTVTNDTTPTLTITAEADTTVEVFKGGVSVGTAVQTAAGSGIYTFTSGTLADGSYNFTAKATDAAGNTSAASAVQNVTVDATAPVAPAITGFSDNSGSTSDTVTNDTTPTLTITAEADTTVEVFKGGVSIGNATQTAAGSGIYTFTSATLADGSYNFTAKATDAAGNTSAASAVQNVTVDGTAPVAPTITGFSDNSGSTSDTVTNDTTPTLTITAEADTTVEVFKGGVSVGNATQTAAGSGIYTFTSATLADGSYSFTAKATDAAGNTSAASAVQNVTVDATAPVAPAITGFSDNSGSADDTVTNDTTPTLTITAEADTTVEVFKGGVSVGTATQTAAGSGIYTFTSATLADGSYNFTAKATDAAGNTSGASAVQNVTVDGTAPVAPTITGFSDNSGSTSDTVTNDTTPTLTITAEANTTVEVFKGGVSVGTATQTAAGSGIYTFTSATLADGSYTFTAKATDAAGNTSPASAAQAITVDASAPVAPTITGFSDNSGLAGDTLTNDTTPTFTISAEANSQVEVFKGGVSVGTATQTAAGSGIYTFTSALLGDGSYNFTVKATDVAGNVSAASAAQNVTVDTAPPTPSAALTTDSGNNADMLTNDARLTLSTLENGAARSFEIDGNKMASYDAAGLSDGKHTIKLTDTDAAGNIGNTSITFTLDSKGPVFSSAASVSVAENIGERQVVYKAAASDDHAFAYSLSGADAAKFDIAADGSVTLKENPNYEAINAYGFNVVATDAAGNQATKAVTLGVTNVNEGPIASTVYKSTNENAAITFGIGDNISDPDAGDKLTVSLNTATAKLGWVNTDSALMSLINPVTHAAVDLSTLNVKASIAADGSITLTPPAELDWMVSNQTLKATISYTVTDAGGLKSSEAIELVITGSTNDKGVNLSGGNGDDTLMGNTSNNAEDVLQGGNGNDILSGYGGTDALYGDSGDDKLNGGAGIDYLYGDSGNDMLDGGSEADYLFGGKGNDIITGGTGADKFVFGPQNGNDRITDFKAASEGDMLFFADFFTTPMTVDAFLSKYVTDTGNDLLINLQGTTITLTGVANISDLRGHIAFTSPV